MVWDNNSYQGIDVSKSFGLLILSFLLYFIYRQFLYNKLITRLHDTKYRKRHNYRTDLKDEFPRLSHQDIIDLFCALRDEHCSTRYSRMEVPASAIHCCHLTGFLATAGMLYACRDSGSNDQISIYGHSGLDLARMVLGSACQITVIDNRQYSYS